MPSDFPWLPSLLQSADPLFPIGSYAHSYGLEEMVAGDGSRSPELLDHFLENVVALNLQEFELPYLRFAREAIKAKNYDLLCELDEEIGASKLSQELRAASSAQGRQRLRLLAKLRPSPLWDALSALSVDQRLVPHHLVAFAAESADSGMPLSAALATWAYQAFAAPCAASLKLLRIGQEGAQAALTRALPRIEPIVERSLLHPREFAGAFLPFLDIAAYRHEKAHARLFIS